MALVISDSGLTRRSFANWVVAGSASCVASEAKAMDPITWFILIVFGGGAAALTISALARQSAWQDRPPGELSRLPPFGQPQEVTPEHRNDRIGLSDGGYLTCRDGTLRPVAPGASTPGARGDLNISEALLCGGSAPYSDQLRSPPSTDPDLSRRRLDDLARLWETPMLRLRYTREMFDARGNPRLLLSAVPRVFPSTEFLTLCEPAGKHWKPVAKLAAEPWTLRGAKDFL